MRSKFCYYRCHKACWFTSILCVLPIQCVPKKTGDKYWIVADLSHLNNFEEAPHVQQESINTVAEQVQAGDELNTFDLKSGFFHVPVHVNSQKFLGFEFQDQFYVWCVLPFGLICSPYFSTKSSIQWCVLSGAKVLSCVFLLMTDWFLLNLGVMLTIEILSWTLLLNYVFLLW